MTGTEDADFLDDSVNIDPTNDGENAAFTLGVEAASTRLDKAVAEALPQLSRARVQSLIAAGALTRNGQVITGGSIKALPGDYVLRIPAPEAAEPQAEDITLDVLFEDGDLIVINKPAGMAAHPAPGTTSGTLVNALLHHCRGSLSGIGGVLRPGIVHRLDKDTSGVMVAAKSDAAHAGLTALFSRHDISRRYVALTRGAPRAFAGRIETQIARAHHDRKKMAVVRAGGRTAITDFETLAICGPQEKPLAARVRCTLHTGRTHQIRVHMAALGAPCLGDPVYGSGSPALRVREAISETGLARQALHAEHLGFVHPLTHKRLRFTVPMPHDMQALAEALELI